MTPPPVVIGGTGGSGTRVVAELVRGLGVYLGTHVNDAIDALAWVAALDAWIPAFLRSQATMPAAEFERMVAELRACAARHRADIDAPDGPWGWKNPRTLYLLPVFDAIFPGMRFVHVVRDGRDVAFSGNQNQTRLYGPLVVGSLAGRPESVQAIGLWAKVNLATARYGVRRMAGRYLRVRLEDLCDAPEAGVRRLGEFLQLSTAHTGTLARLVHPPPTLGRWRDRPPDQIAALEATGAAGLREFGYMPGAA